MKTSFKIIADSLFNISGNVVDTYYPALSGHYFFMVFHSFWKYVQRSKLDLWYCTFEKINFKIFSKLFFCQHVMTGILFKGVKFHNHTFFHALWYYLSKVSIFTTILFMLYEISPQICSFFHPNCHYFDFVFRYW